MMNKDLAGESSLSHSTSIHEESSEAMSVATPRSEPPHFILVQSQRLQANLYASWLASRYPDCEIRHLSASSAVFDKAGAQADVCLLDLSSLQDDWGEFIDEFHYRKVARKVLVFVGDFDERLVSSLRYAAVDGIVSTREDDLEGLAKAVESLLAGKTYISPYFSRIWVAGASTGKSGFRRLTLMETLVLGSVGAGMSKLQIAEELRISPQTVQTHRRNLMRRLRLRTEAEIVAYAFKVGLTKATPQGLSRPGFDIALSARMRLKTRSHV